MRVALHTRVKPGKVEEYEAAHRQVPDDLTAAIRAGGATQWTIWRSGNDLFHVIECNDYAALVASLGDAAIQRTWAVRMANLVEKVHDGGPEGADAELPVIWEL
jgi:L-rhamnose mutarotase